MYRDYNRGTLCESLAWGRDCPATAVLADVTCPLCREKLHGAGVAAMCGDFPEPPGTGDDDDVATGRCCPTCRTLLTRHNRLVWEAGYAIGTRHERETAAHERKLAEAQHREEWATWLESWQGAVGPQPPTIDAVIRWLRADSPPFGRAANPEAKVTDG
jgi:hypothetical protein